LSQSPHFHQKRQINEAVGKAPFVVVPREDLDQLASDNQGGKPVNNGRTRVSSIVARYQGLFTVAENAFEGARFRGLAKGGIYLGHRHFAFQGDRQVDNGDHRNRNPEGIAGQASVQFRDHLAERFSGSAGLGDDREGCGRGSTQILFRLVEQDLAIGIGVGGIHQAVFDAKGLMEHQGCGGKAVGGGASVADNLVASRIVLVMVDSHHHRDIVVLSWRGDDDSLSSTVRDVHLGLGPVGEDPVVVILVRREPLLFERGGVEDGEFRPTHQQRQGAEALTTMLTVIAPAIFILFCSYDDLLEFFGQKVIGWHDIGRLRLLERIHRILAEHVIGDAEGEEGVHPLVLAMRGCLAVIPGGAEFG
jgi:hypothetical protein